MVKTFREENENVLLLDSGNALKKRQKLSELLAETTIEGMNYLRYDALNIGQGELSMDLPFLRDLEKKSLFPFVSANLFIRKTGLPLGEQFVIKEFNGVKAGITGVISPALVMRSGPAREALVVEDPATTLEQMLPELRKKADIVIVLSHLGNAGTKTLVQEVSGIDIAVVGNESGLSPEPETVGNTFILTNCKKGEFMGVLNIGMDAGGKIVYTEGSLEKVADPVAVDPEAYRIVYAYKQKRAIALNEHKKQAKRSKMHDDLMKQLQTMSPAEFMEHMKQESAKTQETPDTVLPGDTPPAAAEGL